MLRLSHLQGKIEGFGVEVEQYYGDDDGITAAFDGVGLDQEKNMTNHALRHGNQSSRSAKAIGEVMLLRLQFFMFAVWF